MSSDIINAMQRMLHAHGATLRVGMPAKVVSYDATKRLASVQIILPEVLEDGTVLPQPIIDLVPVMFSGGDGGALTFPLAVGDLGHVMFADRDISGWVTGQPALETGERQHSLTDAVFFPCYTSQVASQVAMVLSYKGSSISMGANGSVTILPANGTVNVTGNLTATGIVTGNALVATTSLTATTASINGLDFSAHVHPHGSGHGTTGSPEAP